MSHLNLHLGEYMTGTPISYPAEEVSHLTVASFVLATSFNVGTSLRFVHKYTWESLPLSLVG